MLQRLGGLRVVQHLLERIIETLLLADLHHGATVIARVRGRGLLGTVDERLQSGEVWKAFVALDVSETDVEKRQCRPGGEEVLHVAIRRTVEARSKRTPCVEGDRRA